jgi:hypothetical protein
MSINIPLFGWIYFSQSSLYPRTFDFPHIIPITANVYADRHPKRMHKTTEGITPEHDTPYDRDNIEAPIIFLIKFKIEIPIPAL